MRSGHTMRNSGYDTTTGSPTSMGHGRQKKKAFRWIAGTSRLQDDPAADAPKEDGPPKNALSELGMVMTKVLQRIMQTLRAKDIEGRGKGLPARYWIIEDMTSLCRSSAPKLQPCLGSHGRRMISRQCTKPWTMTGSSMG